jgi:signal transduction histidine kinase|tara:strand:- start:1125 stop:1502 length:378 start_codon:yes stop_codon:yes gene_type:complete
MIYRGGSKDWVRAKRYLVDALEYSDGMLDIDDIRDMLARNQADLWMGKDSAIVTQVIESRLAKALLYHLAGGDLKELVEMTEHIENLAKDKGCSKVLINGRAGWGKALGGYKERSRVFEKDLTNE